MDKVRKVFFGIGNYPGLTLKASINSIICFGYKELGSRSTYCKSAWDFKAWRKDINNDKDLVRFVYETLVDADLIITHNGKRFDLKFLNTRLALWGMPPLPSIPHVDTCSVAKANLFMFNNSLKTLGELSGTKKLESGGADLWLRVSRRERKALREMVKYCKGDVKALEALFLKLRPMIKNLPDFDRPGCPACGHARVQKRGLMLCRKKSYTRMQCQKCGHWFKGDSA